MADDDSRYPLPPPDPWAVPGAPAGAQYGAPDGAPPDQRPLRKRSRALVWIAGAVVVALATSFAVVVVIDNRQSKQSSAPAPAPASSSPPSSPAPSPSAGTPSPSSAPSSAPSASPSTARPTAPAAGSAPVSGPGPLDKYVLAPTEVSANSMMFLIVGGRSTTDQATLDWCNFSYASSEKLRATRIQVEYTGNASLAAGNEFVHYQSGGTNRAWAQIQQAVATCPPTSTTGSYTNDLVERAGPDDELVARQLILSYRVTDPTGQLNLPWQAVVYQFDGDYFSGIYVYGQSRSLALAAAEQFAAKSARHLAEASRGKPGTGGGPLQSVTSSPPVSGVQD